MCWSRTLSNAQKRSFLTFFKKQWYYIDHMLQTALQRILVFCGYIPTFRDCWKSCFSCGKLCILHKWYLVYSVVCFVLLVCNRTSLNVILHWYDVIVVIWYRDYIITIRVIWFLIFVITVWCNRTFWTYYYTSILANCKPFLVYTFFACKAKLVYTLRKMIGKISELEALKKYE